MLVFVLIQKMQVFSTEMQSIKNISFVPTSKQRALIYSQSKQAKENPSLCSKIKPPKTVDKEGLIVDPNRSILVKIATGQPLPWNSEGMSLPTIRNEQFAMINDSYNPLLPHTTKDGTVKISSGMNGILTDCMDRRINLFDENDEKTGELLIQYLTFRNKHIEDIFSKTVEHMCMKKASNNNYKKICELFSKINTENKFRDIMGVVSFCQTWCDSESTYGPQFSVESPHFQTRFYVKNEEKFKEFATDEEIEAYLDVINKYDIAMCKLDYGGMVKSKKFINLDLLLNEL